MDNCFSSILAWVEVPQPSLKGSALPWGGILPLLLLSKLQSYYSINQSVAKLSYSEIGIHPQKV